MLDTEIKTVHLIAICGTGMGSFAGLLREAGFKVTGSDENVYPPMSTQLDNWGIPVMQGYKPENLSHNPDLVIVGNVCRRENPECTAARDLNLRTMSFPQALSQFFLSDRHPIVVTGTHGKTTTSSLLATILELAGQDPSFMIGGVLANFEGNFKLSDSKYFIVEGDEYDTAYFDKGPKFLHYQPHSAILTSIEFDHADIFRDLDHVIEAFDKFIDLIPPDGYLAVCGDDPLALSRAQQGKCKLESVGLGAQNDLRATDVQYLPDGTQFNLIHHGQNIGQLKSPMVGEHNIKNLLCVCAVLFNLGLDLQQIQNGLNGFKGIAKRQEHKGTVNNITVIDDFAHHPTAVRETLSAIRNQYPDKKIWALFEAKSNTSRMKIFQEDYITAFLQANEVVFAKPYKKKDNLKADEQIDMQQLVSALEKKDIKAHLIPDYTEIATYVAQHAEPGDIILGMSGSSFGNVHQIILDQLHQRF
jgi:UDP-N-acetylmuramate: L-alanyl-gamma-D-glutamyl-meso-diaminopimelate ligase